MATQNTQRNYSKQEILDDLKGLDVRYWDGMYADELLRRFFPVEANISIDFTLED